MADLTHDAIWDALDRLATSRGWTASGLARRAGLDATSFNPSKRIGLNRKPRWPSTESVSLALKAAECSLYDFFGFLGAAAEERIKTAQIHAAPDRDTKGTDYDIAPDDADFLKGIVGFNHDIRASFIAEYTNRHGITAIIELFSQFIGMANSVIANNREMAEMLLITEGGMWPQTAEKANLPTIFGALEGITLAATCTTDKTCAGCAYRVGTPANQSPFTTSDARWQQDVSRRAFMCHEELDEKNEPTKVCIGHASVVSQMEKSA